MERLDATNLRILDLLQQEGRIPVTELAPRVGRSESTVRDRLGALLQGGTVRAVRADVDLRRVGIGVHGWFRADIDLERIGDLRGQMEAIPHVGRAVLTTGNRPLLMEIFAKDMEHLEEILETQLGPLGLRGVETDIEIQVLVKPRPPNLAALLGREPPPLQAPA